MKRAERKELDKFIKEKLAISRDTSKLDYTPTDMTEKKQQLLDEFANSIKKREHSTKTDKSRPKKLILGLASAATSMVLIGIIILVAIFNTQQENFYYNDEDLTSSRYTLAEFQENFNILLPDMTDAVSATIRVYKSDERNVNVYAKLIVVNTLDEEIELVIVFVNNYVFLNEQQYNSLTKTGQTPIFPYSYNFIEDIEVSYAKFIYGEHRYYIKLISETPSNITSILESFT